MARPPSVARQLVNLFNAAQIPVYCLDAERRILYCNLATAKWTGVTVDELMGRPVAYTTSTPGSEVPGLAAGLCPPPRVFDGEAAAAHVSCMAASGRLVYRRAEFLPLPMEGDEIAVVAIVLGGDLSAADLAEDGTELAPSDQLHQIVAQFRADQKRAFAHPLLGNNPAIKLAQRQRDAAVASRASVVVSGPSGSGRAYLARNIFYGSREDDHERLVPIRGALVESAELWSLLATASPGDRVTLLIEEADALSHAAQATLAEVLQTQLATTRILATTQQPLRQLAESGVVVPSLAPLLATLEIELPPLVERLSDLPLLAQFFVEEQNTAGQKQVEGFTSPAMELLVSHSWPDNLDELNEVVTEAHQTSQGPLIVEEDLPAKVHHSQLAALHPAPDPQPVDLEAILSNIETRLIVQSLRSAGGNKAQAARLLGLTRPKLYRRLEQLGLDPESP